MAFHKLPLGEKVAKKRPAIRNVLFFSQKTVIKNNLVPRMTEVLFTIMCEPYEDEEEDEDDQESSSPAVCACQTLDQLAINLPPAKFLPTLLNCVQSAMASNDPHQVRTFKSLPRFCCFFFKL